MAKKITPEDDVFTQINKKFGHGTVRMLADAPADYCGVPTASKALDIALGGKGLPRGRIIELFGGESSSKTSLALQTVGMLQKAGEKCAYIDAEHALNLEWARRLGVEFNTLAFVQPDWGEQALQVAEAFIKSKQYSLIIIDSVAALVPKAELDGEATDQHVGLQSRMMGQAIRRLTGVIDATQATVVFINQMRDTIGKFGFGPKTTTPGGRALKFAASVRIELARVSTIKKAGEAIGIQVKAKVVKNKMAPPFRECEFRLFYENGIVDV